MNYFDMLLDNLRGNIPEAAIEYLPKEHAYDLLRAMTGVDCGYDADAWQKHRGEYEAKMKKERESLISRVRRRKHPSD